MLERRDRENRTIRALLPQGKKVTLECFWVIDVQTLCHIPHKPDCKYLPCELGVVCYSLNQGIHSKFHRFIHPGQWSCSGCAVGVVLLTMLLVGCRWPCCGLACWAQCQIWHRRLNVCENQHFGILAKQNSMRVCCGMGMDRVFVSVILVF